MARILIALICLFMLSACCAKPEPVYLIEYKDVYIPVKCEIRTPARPKYDENAALSVAAIINYAKELELAVEACK